MKESAKKTIAAFLKNRLGFIGGALALLILFTALLAPYLAPYTPTEMNLQYRQQGPILQHPFGTDRFGRDILSRIIYGSRVSLMVGMISVGIGVFGGILLGLYAGYYSGLLDSVVMWTMDMLMSFPSILLALVVISVLGPNLTNTMIAIGITYVPIFTRIVRSSALKIKGEEFVEAAFALGSSDGKILFKHVLPNSLAPVIVQATLALSGAILTEAALSFLGLGVQPPMPSWGSMLSDSRRYMELAPWTVIFPAIAIMISVLSFNILGDGLRDVLDPKLK